MFNNNNNNVSTNRWLGFELSVLRRLKFSSIAIPFSGWPDLDWYLKFWGKQILSNDICEWAWWVSRAFVENQGELLTEEDVSMILSEAYVPRRKLENPALAQWMGEMDSVWFDNIRINIDQIENEHRRALAIATALKTGDYAFSFRPETARLKRPLSEVFITLWRRHRQIINNTRENFSGNLDGGEFIKSIRAELMFARFPRPEGISSLRRGIVGWRETWVRGTDEAWDHLIQDRRGKLGDDVMSKENYLTLVSNFLEKAADIPKWAIAHTEDGFISAAEMGEIVRKFRRIDVSYNKNFSEVVGGKNSFIIIA